MHGRHIMNQIKNVFNEIDAERATRLAGDAPTCSCKPKPLNGQHWTGCPEGKVEDAAREIIRTLRPTDPGSWEANMPYVVARLNSLRPYFPHKEAFRDYQRWMDEQINWLAEKWNKSGNFINMERAKEMLYLLQPGPSATELAATPASTARTDGPKYKHKANCLWATPLPTGAGFWGCDCGLDKLLLDLEDYEVAAPGSVPQAPKRPTIVVLCGSTRFYSYFQEANYRETMAGKIVLSIGFYPRDGKHNESVGCTPEQKIALDELYFRKIELADEVLVLNVGGYMGESTTREVAYAAKLGKKINYLEAGVPQAEPPK